MKLHKKFLFKLFAVAMVLLCVMGLPQTARAASESDLVFTENDQEASCRVYSCKTRAQGELVIPATHNGLPVTRIGREAFAQCIGLTSVVIPDSVTAIDYWAFYNCREITEITVPASVTTIDACAFQGCTKLTGMVIPSGVTAIPDRVFYDCSSLASVVIPGSVTTIGTEAFGGCRSLSTVIYCGTEDQWEAITKGDYNAPLTNANLQLHSYENDTCTYCGATNKPVLTFTLNGAGDAYTVTGCDQSATGKMVIPATYQDLPVTAIGEGAFYGCAGLTELVISEGVTAIEPWAFADCIGLTGVTLPSTLADLGYSAFSGCNGLQGVYIRDLEAWCKMRINGGGLDGGKDNPLHYAGNLYLNGELVTEVTIPDSITSLGHEAFGGCTSLTGITIPATVTGIGNEAFFGCKNLVEISLPKGITAIGTGTFYDCTGLTDIAIPDSVTSIGWLAFYNCTSLTNVAFCGTQAQWDAISKDASNTCLKEITLRQHNYESGACTVCGQKTAAAGDINGNSAVEIEDAVYLLLHTLFGEEDYPLSGANADFNGDGAVGQEDTVYLLLHIMFGETCYPLKKS